MFELGDDPKISLALPVYNGERFVADAVRSILAQDFKNFELIITDNASTDRTEEICRAFAAADQRVRYFRNERNLGAGPNYNLGLSLSRGKYFKWCACDDRISENFLSACYAALEANEKAVLAYGTTQSIDDHGSVIPLVGVMRSPELPNEGAAVRFKRDLRDGGTNFEVFGLFRTAALGMTTLHRSYYGSDRTLMSEMALLGSFVFVPGIVFYNREHKDRSINMRDKKALASWQDTSAPNNRHLSNLERLAHLVEIAIRHRKVVPPISTLSTIALWALQPAQFSRCATDLVGIVSPSAQLLLLRTGRSVVELVEATFGALQPRMRGGSEQTRALAPDNIAGPVTSFNITNENPGSRTHPADQF
jgi:glycosyltransferase involved in cell wall biosynthesis